MKDYSTAKIYRIVGGEKTYYGSTLQPLHKRLSAHKGHMKRYDEEKSTQYCSSYEVLAEPNCGIYLVEAFTTCKNRDELNARERYYVENNVCVNSNIPGRTNKEWEVANFEKRAEQRRLLENKKKKTYWTCPVCCIQVAEIRKAHHVTKDKMHLVYTNALSRV